MLFIENKPTEPYTFRIIKNLCSFSLIIILLFYIYNQFSQFFKLINTPNLTLRKRSVDEFDNNITISIGICSSDADVLICKHGYNPNKPSTPCPKAKPYPPELDIVPFKCNNAKKYLRYSFDYRKIIKVMISNTVNDFGVYLDEITIDEESYVPFEFQIDMLDLIYSNKQNMIIYYSPTIISRITSNYAYGFINGGQVKKSVYFNAHVDRSTLTATNGTTEFILSTMSMDIYYQDESYYDRNY